MYECAKEAVYLARTTLAIPESPPTFRTLWLPDMLVDIMPNDYKEIQDFRRRLGLAANEYSDAQLVMLRREMYAMAELLLDIFLDKQNEKSATGPGLTDDHSRLG